MRLLMWSQLPKSYYDVALLYDNWLRNMLPTSSLQGEIPLEVWTCQKIKLKDSHAFGCSVQYLKVGSDMGRKGAKYASRTSFGIFLGMPPGQTGFLVFDPLRASVLVRRDVRFYDDIPGYPRLVGQAPNPP